MRHLIGRTMGPGTSLPVRRRKAAPRWVRPLRRTALAVGVAAVTIGTPAWLWHAGLITQATTAVRDFAISQTARAGLTVANVLMAGRRYTPRRTVLHAVGVSRGDPLLGIDIEAMRGRLLGVPWIREATVVRRFPDTVDIRIVERQPFALWQRKGRLVLVDPDGVVITAHELGAFRSLPILVGKDAPHHARTLFAMLNSEPRLARQVISAVHVGRRRWNIEFRNGIKVWLPEVDPHVAWRRLAQLDARHQLLARDVRVIDMRLPDRLILQPGPLSAQTMGKKGRKT